MDGRGSDVRPNAPMTTNGVAAIRVASECVHGCWAITTAKTTDISS
ncbi:hypothetical protein SynWH8103_02479 [Synechococcus sp. WH 8103]|nr:hypothetical protein SynWH8103_02479 [Synechococcus sp. WH 8103]